MNLLLYGSMALQVTFSFSNQANIKIRTKYEVGGAVASWLARSTPEQALRVRALAGDIVLCSWARHFTLMVPLSTQGPVVRKTG